MSEEGTIDRITVTVPRIEAAEESKDDISESLSTEDIEDGDDFDISNKELLHLSTKMNMGVANYLYDWITEQGGTIGGSAALAMELTRQNKNQYIGWKPNDIDIYFKLDHDIYHDPRRWNDIKFSKKINKVINDSFISHFGKHNLDAYYQQSDKKQITFKDSIHESYGNTTRFLNTPPVDDAINMEISVSNFKSNATHKVHDTLLEVIEDINVNNPHKLPGDLYTVGTEYREGDSRLNMNTFPQLRLKKGTIVDARLAIRDQREQLLEGVLLSSFLFINSNHRVDVAIRDRLGLPLQGQITSDIDGISDEQHESYNRAKEDIELLREEANEVAKLAAKQTNTILPEFDDSKPQGGYGYTAVQVGTHNSVFGLVPNSHLKVVKRNALPNIQLIFIYGNLSIPTYIDHYYDFSICKVYIDTEKRNKDENIDAPIDILHPDVVFSNSLDTPQNQRHSTLLGVMSTVALRFIKYIARGFIPIQIRDRILKLKNSNVIKGWEQHIGIHDIITPIYHGFTEFLDDLEFYFLQKIVDIENSKQPLRNKLFSYRAARHMDLIDYISRDIEELTLSGPGTPFFEGFFRGITKILETNNMSSDIVRQLSPHHLQKPMQKAIVDFYGRLENILKLYNKLSRDDDLSGILIDMRFDINIPVIGIQSYARAYTLRDQHISIGRAPGEDMDTSIDDWLENYEIIGTGPAVTQRGRVERSNWRDQPLQYNPDGDFMSKYGYVMMNMVTRKTDADMEEIENLEKNLNSRKMGRIQNILDNSFDDSYPDQEVKRIQGIDDIHSNISQHLGGDKVKKHKLLKYVYSN